MSWITTLLVSLLSLGIGLLGGFSILYQQYASECQTVVKAAEAKAKQSSQQLHVQNEDLTKSLLSCRSEAKDSSKKCHDAQRQSMDTHSKLMEQHQQILKEHSNAVDTISTLQKTVGQHEQTLEKLQAQRDELSASVESLTESANQDGRTTMELEQQIVSLTSQLDIAQSMLQQKMQEVSSLEAQREQPDDDPSTIVPFAAMEKLRTLQSAIRRQHHAQARLRHGGHVGPFFVQFDLAVVGSDHYGHGSMIVELSRDESYSMTLGTFLNMVEAELYVGTVVGSNGSVIAGGSPLQTASKRVQAHLTRKFAEYGLGMEPFLWIENADCTETDADHVFWFPSLSPKFQIGLDTAVPTSCHGHVVHGLPTLYEMLDEASRRNSVLDEDDPPVQVVIEQTNILLSLPEDIRDEL